MREVYLKIKGRVQGVGFRRWAQKEALKIGNISGCHAATIVKKQIIIFFIENNCIIYMVFPPSPIL